VLADVDDLVDQLADDLLTRASQTVQHDRPFHMALSGGSTPQVLYQRMIIDPRYRLFPWDRTQVWLIDERCVDVDDEQSNFRMIHELLLQHVPIDPSHVHPMPATDRQGDRAYEAELEEALGEGGRLDFALLGMGADGHTASLFPRSPALAERRRRVVFNSGDAVAPPRPRMTMTYPTINAARTIAILVIGEAKRPAIQRAALVRRDIERLPITGIDPNHDDGELIWYLDEAAVRSQSNARPF
jgi:6-phosphogluconolactonase